jgi:ABC-2 type transport system ATP-binding protein
MTKKHSIILNLLKNKPNLMIQLETIDFGYSKKRLLFENLTLELSRGHIYGLLGKNGAGKTTLLKLISGLRFISNGFASVLHENPALRKPNMLQEIAFLPEEIYTPALKIKEFVKAYAPFYPHFNHEQFQEYLSTFEIEHQDYKIDKISFGQKKKVMIAFALACNTKILIMDEPTNALDIPSKAIFRKLMAPIPAEDRIVIISTHQVRDLHSLIDAIIVLDSGKVILNESTETITEKLAFEVMEDTENDPHILYEEDNMRGKAVVRENTTQKETKMDIELLFNALMLNKEKIQHIFNPKK